MNSFGDKSYSVEKQDDRGKEWRLPLPKPHGTMCIVRFRLGFESLAKVLFFYFFGNISDFMIG